MRAKGLETKIHSILDVPLPKRRHGRVHASQNLKNMADNLASDAGLVNDYLGGGIPIYDVNVERSVQHMVNRITEFLILYNQEAGTKVRLAYKHLGL